MPGDFRWPEMTEQLADVASRGDLQAELVAQVAQCGGALIQIGLLLGWAFDWCVLVVRC